MVDVKQTADQIKGIADTMRHYANELDYVFDNMNKKQDITYVSEALQIIRNCFGNLRIDLLATIPIREFERLQRENKEKLF